MTKADLMKKLFVMSLLAGIVISLTLIGYFQEKQSSKEGEFTLKINFIGNASSETFNNTAATLSDALGAHHTIKTTVNGYVKCIDSICSGSDYQWLFYANGKRINAGIDYYHPKKGDVIEFKFEMS